MPHMDHLIGVEIPPKKTMTVTLEEGERILPCLKYAMKQNNVSECRVVDVSGFLKEGVVSFHDGDRQRYKTLKDAELLRATGTLKLSYDELYGSVQLTTRSPAPFTGTLIRGTASSPLEFRCSFIPVPRKEG